MQSENHTSNETTQDNVEWAMRVIDSCQNTEQLFTASKIVDLFERNYYDIHSIILLRDSLSNKKVELLS